MGTTNYFAEVFDDVGEGWDEWSPRDYILRDRKLRRFRVSTHDNPFIPTDYIPNLLDTFQGNKNYEKAWIFGHFCPLVEGSAYQNYNPAVHDIDDIEPDPHLPINLCWDFNSNPLAWTSIQERKWSEFEDYGEPYKHVAIHNADRGNGQLDEAVVEFAAKHPVHRFSATPIRLYGDMSGHAGSHKSPRSDYENIKAYLKQLGYERVSIEALRHNPLETVSVEAVNYWFQIHKLMICKRCSKLRRSFLSTRWKENTRKLDKPASDDWTHWSDGVKYYCYAKQRNDGKKLRSTNPR